MNVDGRKVVLHVCCGPCASACVPVLRDLGNEVVLFYSNSNIDTRDEFEKRLDSARKLAEADGVELVADEYDHADWLEKVAKGLEDVPEKGARCAKCFRYNLARAAAWAAKHGCEAFTTSLTVSPHKVSRMVFAAGADAAWEVSAKECGGSSAAAPEFLPVDFKKKDGFLRSFVGQRNWGCTGSPTAAASFRVRHMPPEVCYNIPFGRVPGFQR